MILSLHFTSRFLNTALPMVICLFVGCMCSPCVKKRSPVKTFPEPMGNSLVLLQALRDLSPSWDISAEQAFRAWVLSMPSSIRARLDGLSLEELQQLSGASPPPPASSTVYTQTVRLFRPRSPARSLLTSFDTTESQHSVFTTIQAMSTASLISVFGNAQASLSATPRPSFAVAAAPQPRPAAYFRGFTAFERSVFRRVTTTKWCVSAAFYCQHTDSTTF